MFLAGSADEAAALLNPALVHAGAVAQLVVTPDGHRLEVAPGEQGLTALAARLPAALAGHIAQRGMGASARARRGRASARSSTTRGAAPAGSAPPPATTARPRGRTGSASAAPPDQR